MQRYNSHQREVWEAYSEGGRGHIWIMEVKIWKAMQLLSTLYPIHWKRKGIVGKTYGQILTDACSSKKTVLEETSSDKTRMCSKTSCQAYAKNTLRTYKIEIIILFLASKVPGELLVKSARRLNAFFLFMGTMRSYQVTLG